MNKPAAGIASLISDDYREIQQKLHENPDYGVASVHYAPIVAEVIESVGANEVLDYGAGKGRLADALGRHIKRQLIIHRYDPAIPRWSAPPKPCEFVACIDVLEHIEPDLIDNVLDDLMRVTTRVGVFTVHTGKAAKILPDGRNAHLIQQPPAWWLPRIAQRFEVEEFHELPEGFWVRVEALGDKS